MNDSIDRRDYGRLEAQVEQLTKDVHALRLTVEMMSAMMQEAKGGWRAIAMMAGVAGTFGAAVSWIATHVKFS
jgi:hypothetical protein